LELKLRHYLLGSTALGAAALLCAPPAMAQAAGPTAPAQKPASADATVTEVIVTAEKREESINKVPMSITAVTAVQLRDAGVTQVRDLVKLTPGFTYADSGTGTPIYTIRGVGFSDVALTGRPTVTVYADQAPIPFSIEARGVSLDLERVEVLKGPQGTLFGTNSTGGAINFIAAKPTSDFEAGADLSLGTFNATQASAFVSGPVAPTLEARIAIEHDGMDDWQKSYTTGARNGAEDFWNGRGTLAWTPNDKLKAVFTLGGWVDHSDTQAEQFIGEVPTTPFPVPQLTNYPIAPHNDQAADFDLGRDYRKNNEFVQANLRLDYNLTDKLTLTSLTSYSHYHENQLSDLDGTTVSNNYFNTFGNISSISEEVRLAGSFAERGHFTIGANYVDDKTFEFDSTFSPISSVSNLFSSIFGESLPVTFDVTSDEHSTTEAAFASADYDLTSTINVYGGVRYTDFRTDFNGCASDNGDGVAATIFTVLDGTTVHPGQCFTLTQAGTPGIVSSTLQENNVSWRGGAQWAAAPDVMFYVNVSKGYKAGSFPIIPANDFHALLPVKEEAVLAYEGGFKIGLFDHAVQLNGAVFHYDYTDKQVLGSTILPGVGAILKLINIPQSAIDGGELEIAATPVSGLKLSTSATYINSGVTSTFLNPDPLGATVDFKGEQFPNTPHWQLSAVVDYKWPVSERFDGLLGGNISYQSKTQSEFGDLPLFATDAYALLDLRAGLETKDGKWRATIWGRNVGNTYYWSAATHVQDAIVRYMGMPATYGISLSYRYQ
jgi:iron complex outermembrane receptor protein